MLVKHAIFSPLDVPLQHTEINTNPIKHRTKRSNPTTVVKIQMLTFKYRKEWLIYDYSFLWFAGNAYTVDVVSWRVCIKILPQQRACQLSAFMLQKPLLHRSCDTQFTA